MKNSIMIPSLIFIGLITFNSCTKDSSDKGKILPTSSQSELTQDEIDGLSFMREEEKLARDVYLKLNETYAIQIFTNISASEQVHMDSILSLLVKYDIEDPAYSEMGLFRNPDLQNIYDDLVSTGMNSLLDALKVGANIEELDIRDLRDYISLTSKSDIIEAYEFLSCGSRNHLRAFDKQVQKNGGTYNTEFLTQQEYDDIAASDHEQCGT